jgi:uncharacterized delta-60 repeat protein
MRPMIRRTVACAMVFLFLSLVRADPRAAAEPPNPSGAIHALFELGAQDTGPLPGELDLTFSGDGRQTTDFGGDDDGVGIAVQADGKILAVGGAGGDFAVARYNADGTLDMTFSDDGKQTTDFAGYLGGWDGARDLAIQPDGRIVVVGTNDAHPVCYCADSRPDFALARYEGGTGSPDTTPPETTVTSSPSGTINDSTPTFSFKSSDGSHTFLVRATDGADNTDPTPAWRSWTIVPVTDYRQVVLAISGLVSYWRLGETSGPTAADARGTHNGSYRNGVLLDGPGALLNDSNASASFDGLNDYVSVADSAPLDTGDSFTLEAWIKRSGASSSTGTVLSKGSGSFRLSFVNSVLTLTKSNSGTIARAKVSTTDTTGFHHVVATKSGATVKLYIDGIDRTGTVTNRTITNTSTVLNIGRDTAGSEYLRGLIDEVAIYTMPLSAGQVLQHFQASGR